MQANGGGKEQPVKRGDGRDQPGRGPGLEDVPKQPAGPAAGLGPRVWGQRRAHAVDRRGEKNRLSTSERDEGKVGCAGKGLFGWKW